MDIPSKDEDSDEEIMALKGEAHDFHRSIMQEIHAQSSPSTLQNDNGSSDDIIRNDKKNKKGVLCQSNEFDVGNKLSKNAKKLLKQIKNDRPRYQEIDGLIEKIKSN